MVAVVPSIRTIYSRGSKCFKDKKRHPCKDKQQAICHNAPLFNSEFPDEKESPPPPYLGQLVVYMADMMWNFMQFQWSGVRIEAPRGN